MESTGNGGGVLATGAPVDLERGGVAWWRTHQAPVGSAAEERAARLGLERSMWNDDGLSRGTTPSLSTVARMGGDEKKRVCVAVLKMPL